MIEMEANEFVTAIEAAEFNRRAKRIKERLNMEYDTTIGKIKKDAEEYKKARGGK